ncbi:hypothetical protein PsYK624_150380 [Phanerochaete sordida]|uniref:Uncharacterized protein n=1 Tax=Phanerochaete sordida TaxID=48140 RepID=A0A9P3LKR6_9APHY|nr:hypothetical protein PsYK624_150380 [Phanerochaete sordida]
MKSFFVIAALAACALAQRLHIVEPAAGATVQSGQQFTLELRQDQTTSSLQQTSVLVAVNSCYDSCSDPTSWGPATVLYNGAFNPQYNSSAPQKGLYQDLQIQLPELQAGGAVIQVAHQFKLGAVLTPVFDYTMQLVNVD